MGLMMHDLRCFERCLRGCECIQAITLSVSLLFIDSPTADAHEIIHLWCLHHHCASLRWHELPTHSCLAAIAILMYHHRWKWCSGHPALLIHLSIYESMLGVIASCWMLRLYQTVVLTLESEALRCLLLSLFLDWISATDHAIVNLMKDATHLRCFNLTAVTR